MTQQHKNPATMHPINKLKVKRTFCRELKMAEKSSNFEVSHY